MLGMDMSVFTNAMTTSVETVALIEAAKKFLKQKKVAVPSWVYTVLSILVSFGLPVIKCPVLEVGLLAFSVSELFYDSIWKTLKNRFDNRGKNECTESEKDC